jgi:hypothetical protein
MKAIICTENDCQILEDLAYDGLVKDKVIDVNLRDKETGELIQQSYSSRVRHHDGRIAFKIERTEKYIPKEMLDKAEELTWDWFCPANQIRGHKARQYWLAYNKDLSVFHTGVTEVGQVTTTGQPNLEHFDTEAELEKRVDELRGRDYYRELESPETIER